MTSTPTATQPHMLGLPGTNYGPTEANASAMRRHYQSVERKQQDGSTTTQTLFVNPGAATFVLDLLRAHYVPMRDPESQQVYIAKRRGTLDKSGQLPPPLGGIVEPLTSSVVKQQISMIYATLVGGEAPSTNVVQSCITTFAGFARPMHRGPALRVGKGSSGVIVIDLGRSDGQCVEVGPEGWEIVDSPTCWLLRDGTVSAMPVPERGGSLEPLWAILPTLPERDRPLVRAWLASALRYGTTPTPLMYLSGGQGSGKTNTMEMLSVLAGGVEKGREELAEDPGDIILRARSKWVSAYDNLSRINSKQSDALCKLVTGARMERRVLHTTSDVMSVSVRRPLIATGIDPRLLPDLESRSLMIKLDRFEDIADDGRPRRPEYQFWADFHEARPFIAGAILDDLVAVLCRTAPPRTDGTAPRMADFDQALGILDELHETDGRGRWDDSSHRTHAETVQDDAVWASMGRVITGAWEGTSAELLDAIDPTSTERRSRAWPSSGQAMKSRLLRGRQDLESAGWIVELNEPENKHRGCTWRLTPPDTGDGKPRHPIGCHCQPCINLPHVAGCHCAKCGF